MAPISSFSDAYMVVRDVQLKDAPQLDSPLEMQRLAQVLEEALYEAGFLGVTVSPSTQTITDVFVAGDAFDDTEQSEGLQDLHPGIHEFIISYQSNARKWVDQVEANYKFDDVMRKHLGDMGYAINLIPSVSR